MELSNEYSTDAGHVTLHSQLNPSQTRESTGKPTSGPAPQPDLSLYRATALIATCTTAMVVNVSNSTAVAISLPMIGRDINLPEAQLQWLLSAYALSSGCLVLFFGRLADLYGRKQVFMLGMVVQVIFAVVGGFAYNGVMLAVFRAFQGLGAAAAMPSAFGILAHSFHVGTRGRTIALTTFAAGAPVGGAFGNVLGGTVTQLSDQHWRTTFWLAAGLSALALLGGLVSIPRDVLDSDVDRRIDWVGAVLVTIGLVLIVFVLGQGELASDKWKTPYIIASLVIGVILVAVFLVWQYHLEHTPVPPNRLRHIWAPPLMKLSFWTRAKGCMSVILVVAFLNWCSFLSWMLWCQLYYQNYLQLNPVRTMLRLIPMLPSGILCNFFVGAVVHRVPLVIIIVSGTLITAGAAVLFALIDPSATYWEFGFPSTCLIVFGADFVYSAGSLFITKVARHGEHSIVGALFQTMIQLGSAFGVTISTIVFNRVVSYQSAELGVTLDSTGLNAPLSAQLQAFRAAQWTSAGFAFLAAVLSAIFLRNVGIVGHDTRPNPGLDAESEETVVLEASPQITREKQLNKVQSA